VSARFAHAVSGPSVAEGWVRCFEVTWFIGFLGGGFVYWLLCLLSPPPGAPYVREAFYDYDQVLEGVDSRDVEGSKDEELRKSDVVSNTREL